MTLKWFDIDTRHCTISLSFIKFDWKSAFHVKLKRHKKFYVIYYIKHMYYIKHIEMTKSLGWQHYSKNKNYTRGTTLNLPEITKVFELLIAVVKDLCKLGVIQIFWVDYRRGDNTAYWRCNLLNCYFTAQSSSISGRNSIFCTNCWFCSNLASSVGAFVDWNTVNVP